jgi:hypothetical protein
MGSMLGIVLQAGGTAQLSELAAKGSLAAAPTYVGMVFLLLVLSDNVIALFVFWELRDI